MDHTPAQEPRAIFYAAADMSGLYRYFSSRSLPTSEDTGLPSAAVASANEAVQKGIVQNASEQPCTSKKRKYTTTFREEDRAKIGKFAAQHGNASAVNHFKGKFDLSESTVRYLKQRYLRELGI